MSLMSFTINIMIREELYYMINYHVLYCFLFKEKSERI